MSITTHIEERITDAAIRIESAADRLTSAHCENDINGMYRALLSIRADVSLLDSLLLDMLAAREEEGSDV